MSDTVAWLGLDCHSRQCTFAWIDDSGVPRAQGSVPTEREALVAMIHGIAAQRCRVILEQCEISGWIARLLRPLVEELVVCDPRHNDYISRQPDKADAKDALRLAELLRLGAYKAIWLPTHPLRLGFRRAASLYEEAVRRQARLKTQIRGEYRQWGVPTPGTAVFGTGRDAYLRQLPAAVQPTVRLMHETLDGALAMERSARRQLVQQARAFPEVARLRTVPGVGPIGASLFVAHIQDPGRFATASKLSRYCRLGIVERSSDGKSLGRARLDPMGNGTLKAVAHRAWISAMRAGRGAVWEYHEASLRRTGSRVHARLNVMRKVVETLWRLWAANQEFDAGKFSQSSPTGV